VSKAAADSGKPSEAKGAKAMFPGGNAVPDKGELRIAVEKRAYAAIIGHAVLEPEVEVCGVLVGTLLQDAHGDFLHVTSAIRGEAAKQQGAQVTFTHETWNHIHREMDAHHPAEQIVGWYHTHGGFGIFLSEMDAFIQRNFFSAPHQVAFVFDPLAGSEGFFQAREDKLVLCRRHWVGGRERKGARPPEETEPAPAPRPAGGDLALVTAALQKTAAALQASANRAEESNIPTVAWIAGGALVLGLAWMILTGQPILAPRGEADPRQPKLLLLLENDRLTGQAAGVEIHSVAQHQGPVYRDAAGHLYMAVELRGLDGRPVSSSELLAQVAAAAALRPPPDPPPPSADKLPALLEQAGRKSRWLLPLVAAGVAVLGAAAAGFWFWRKRRSPI